MKPRLAVLFDLDGTLIDSTAAIIECFELALAELGDPIPSREAIVASISMTLEDQLALFCDRPPAEAAAVYRRYYREIGPAKTALMPGATDTLEALSSAGARIGFATSKLRASAEDLLSHLGALHYFEARVGPEDVVRTKPHPDPLLKALAQLDCPAGSAWYIGDSFYDAQAADAAGVRCILVTTGYLSRRELQALPSEAVVDSLGEAAELILSPVHLRG